MEWALYGRKWLNSVQEQSLKEKEATIGFAQVPEWHLTSPIAIGVFICAMFAPLLKVAEAKTCVDIIFIIPDDILYISILLPTADDASEKINDMPC